MANTFDKIFISMDDTIQNTVPKEPTYTFCGVKMGPDRVRDRDCFSPAPWVLSKEPNTWHTVTHREYLEHKDDEAVSMLDENIDISILGLRVSHITSAISEKT